LQSEFALSFGTLPSDYTLWHPEHPLALGVLTTIFWHFFCNAGVGYTHDSLSIVWVWVGSRAATHLKAAGPMLSSAMHLSARDDVQISELNVPKHPIAADTESLIQGTTLHTIARKSACWRTTTILATTTTTRVGASHEQSSTSTLVHTGVTAHRCPQLRLSQRPTYQRTSMPPHISTYQQTSHLTIISTCSKVSAPTCQHVPTNQQSHICIHTS
jgi:hypothetical protein